MLDDPRDSARVPETRAGAAECKVDRVGERITARTWDADGLQNWSKRRSSRLGAPANRSQFALISLW